MQEKTEKLDIFAEETSRNMKTFKTLVMYINLTPSAPVLINGEAVDFVENFTY